ncbi:MAG TPA: glycosyltransferase family 4 protein [Pyrinomonadaceae bacterium]|nr:glycosyltransferase family 4 protein [Pyrinomonadaceae bacterium]
MKVLGLCSYPIEAPATRFRLYQFVKPLAERNIDLTICPFLDSETFSQFYTKKNIVHLSKGIIPALIKRSASLLDVKKFDVIWVQREAMFFGPAIFENLYRIIGNRPMILDLDDPTYLSYTSPTFGKLGSYFKFFGKTDKLIENSRIVICGNQFIADYVREKGTEAVIIPTVVDTEIFHPVNKPENDVPVIGWIGTHSTFPCLEIIFPVIQQLAQKHQFKLKIVGSGKDKVEIKGVEIENSQWTLEREVSDFQFLDIGLYPVYAAGSLSATWILGKSGFKAIQYLACGIPFVMSPVGVCSEIGEPNITHFNAVTEEDWYNSLDTLLSDSSLRNEMGARGREYSLQNYTVSTQADILANTFYKVKN